MFSELFGLSQTNLYLYVFLSFRIMIGVMMMTGMLFNNPFKTEDKYKQLHLQVESNGFLL